jgi:hypothetical protein
MIKYHQKGSVLFITFSVEEGLLFQANPLWSSPIFIESVSFNF